MYYIYYVYFGNLLLCAPHIVLMLFIALLCYLSVCVYNYKFECKCAPAHNLYKIC